MQKSDFYQRCEAVFSGKHGYGRRWKTAASNELGIGRATLYKYFEHGAKAPPEIIRKLEILSDSKSATKQPEHMVRLFARGLVDLQTDLDEHDRIGVRYPATLQRAFDIASAQNILAGAGGIPWPTDLPTLARLASRNMYEWPDIDLGWLDDHLLDASLIEAGTITPECEELAAAGRDPETELTENEGYNSLLTCCYREPTAGPKIYSAIRKILITQPVNEGWQSLYNTHDILSIPDAYKILPKFYRAVPESHTIVQTDPQTGKSQRVIPVCRVSNLALTRQRKKHEAGFHTECQDPKAIQFAENGEYGVVSWTPSAWQLRRAFRRYWSLPGLAEIELADKLHAAGWSCELWPNYDEIDVIATHPAHQRGIAVDVKDYRNPRGLARRFPGFKSYSNSHNCYIVVPDYRIRVEPGYEQQFHATRSANGLPPVDLHSVSGLLAELKNLQEGSVF